MTFFDLARRNVSRHWLRSSLAVIGIVIGVVAIASMGILGNSIGLMFNDMITDVGDTIIVSPAMSSGTTAFTERQVNDIARAAGSNRVIPFASTFDTITVGETKSGAMIYAIPAGDIPFLLEKEAGTYPRETGAGCMIGSKLAANSKKTGLKLGARVQIGDETLRVTGVLKERGMGFDINPDYAIVVPYRWYSNHYDEDEYDQVIVKVRDINDLDRVKKAIEEKMNRREDVVNVMDTKVILESVFAAADSITVFLMGIGAISLIVAGVSILNVMMMSVTERIKEIGVLRSIGTRRSEVMRMFIYEAMIIGIAGAIIGGVLSFCTGYLMTAVLVGSPEYLFNPTSLLYIVFGMAFGIITSVASGLYPAWKAAHLNPIQALRHE
ncbi:MAG TPA: ABC transporter permease [Candidatus Methanoculleus thermohydrogenotrophicum]|jgi:putative ABC transport system permease protein|nr:ABC transporter permease [Candidatus Methanoculleus thermohydrogenotrophicum]HPZ37349.1 ABC transporter permease [Candidatus Methanoculleus thermohydrogenotrophicum]HQC91221.1 ABC transporter permease [Candidatus Methanoculleus thermohydrogenotrophicum]